MRKTGFIPPDKNKHPLKSLFNGVTQMFKRLAHDKNSNFIAVFPVFLIKNTRKILQKCYFIYVF